MNEEERRKRAADRRNRERRGKPRDRRRGPGPMMESRRTRFSILYFVLAFLLLLGLNYMLSEGSTKQIPVSYTHLRAPRDA